MVAPAQSEHAREADARQAAIYRAMTPRQRLEQALRMNATPTGPRHKSAAPSPTASSMHARDELSLFAARH